MEQRKSIQSDPETLIQMIHQLVPTYTPEWRFTPEHPDPGTTLYLLLAEMLAGNVERLEQLPQKMRMVFLNYLNESRLHAKPALGYLRFVLSNGCKQSVWIDAKTEAQAKAADGKGQVFFETMADILATPAKIIDWVHVHPELDLFCKLSDQTRNALNDPNAFGFPLFDAAIGDNRQEHILYLRQDDALQTKGAIQIDILWQNRKQRFREVQDLTALTSRDRIRWQFYHSGSWHDFEQVILEDHLIRLIKTSDKQIDRVSVHNQFGYWLRAVVNERIKEQDSNGLHKIFVDRVAWKASNHLHVDHASEADLVFMNDLQLDAKQFLPFGEWFTPYSTCYFGSLDALSKRGATVEMRFQLSWKMIPFSSYESYEQIDWKLIMKASSFVKPEPKTVRITRVAWEYWNGNSWGKLKVDEKFDAIFYVPEDHEAHPLEVSMKFVCPADMHEMAVNSHTNYWIRARLLTAQNLFSSYTIYQTPQMENVQFRYQYFDWHAFQQIHSLNQMRIHDLSDLVNGTAEDSIAIFSALDVRDPAIEIAYDLPPDKGPIRQLIWLERTHAFQSDAPELDWYYFHQQGATGAWKPLKIDDQTNGLQQSGIISWNAANDFLKTTRYGTEGYWIRVVCRQQYSKTSDFPYLKAWIPNTVQLIQQTTIRDEHPRQLDDAGWNKLMLANTPILEAEIWLDETHSLTARARDCLLQEQPEDCHVYYDSRGHIQKVWIRWKETKHFQHHHEQARVYRLDRVTGVLQFGDGKYGKKPSIQSVDQIRVNYTYTNGQRGNVSAYEIKSLQSSIAFVDRIENPQPTSGGCAVEAVASASARIPSKLRHRERAVTLADFESIARQSHPSIHRVKAMQRMDGQTGVQLLISTAEQIDSLRFQVLKQQIEQDLRKKSSMIFALPQAIQVKEPIYLAIHVKVKLLVTEADRMIQTEKEAYRLLQAFLHPVTGHFDGQGWEIGELIHRSMLLALLKNIEHVKQVEWLHILGEYEHEGVRKESDLSSFPGIEYVLIQSGRHEIQVAEEGGKEHVADSQFR